MQFINISSFSVIDSADNIFIIKYKIFVGFVIKVNSSLSFDSLLKFSKTIKIIFSLYLIEFIQIDVKDFSEEIFIIIRDQKDDDYNEGTLIIYDSEVPIPLLNGQALNMRKFMDDTK